MHHKFILVPVQNYLIKKIKNILKFLPEDMEEVLSEIYRSNSPCRRVFQQLDLLEPPGSCLSLELKMRNLECIARQDFFSEKVENTGQRSGRQLHTGKSLELGGDNNSVGALGPKPGKKWLIPNLSLELVQIRNQALGTSLTKP